VEIAIESVGFETVQWAHIETFGKFHLMWVLDCGTKLVAIAGPAAAARVISDCHFAVPLNHFIPVFLSYSVAVFLT
jgi:hypothetical protein